MTFPLYLPRLPFDTKVRRITFLPTGRIDILIHRRSLTRESKRTPKGQP